MVGARLARQPRPKSLTTLLIHLRGATHACAFVAVGNADRPDHFVDADFLTKESPMGFGRGALLWMLGIPLPIILLLALFMHR